MKKALFLNSYLPTVDNLKKTLFLICAVLLFTCCDKESTEPKIVKLSIPSENGIVHHKVKVTANVVDGSEMLNVEFFVNGVSKSIVSNAPYEFEWDTGYLKDGHHEIYCVALGTNGDEVESETLKVRVVNNLLDVYMPTPMDEDIEGLEKIFFISDAEGEIIASKTLPSAQKYLTIKTPENLINVPDQVTVSYFFPTWYSYKEGLKSSAIHTYFMVPAGSKWTYGKNVSHHTGQAKIEFEDVPTHDGYVLSTNYSNYKWGSNLSSQQDVRFNGASTDLFLCIYKSDNAQYKWIENILHGSSNKVGFENMQQALSKNVLLEISSDKVRKLLFGYREEGRQNRNYYLLDAKTINDPGDRIKIYYPEEVFPKYRTLIYSYHPNGHEYYHQSIYGTEIDTTFKMFKCHFIVENASSGNFKMTPNTNLHLLSLSKWQTGEDFKWHVYAPGTLLSYKMPNIPERVKVKLRGVNIEDLFLSEVNIYDYPELDSYNEFIGLRFHENPNIISSEEFSTYRCRTKLFNRSKSVQLDAAEFDHGMWY